ncbi:CLUMA_CG008585, isoform A [Clunio marinus]|uniref:CLUMA_CG008585, isoform A n=1 Tax=Clunio marinus TaxID=568069 RepID=A0A1J1I4I8_9DIPT|nr:CLUMA_CG008585, isoform A [Clunio marinus]
MKHEQVVPDYVMMLESSITVLALVACGWLLFKLVSACFWFPQYMKNLEVEAEKAQAHLENKLLPKDAPTSQESEIKESPTDSEILQRNSTNVEEKMLQDETVKEKSTDEKKKDK